MKNSFVISETLEGTLLQIKLSRKHVVLSACLLLVTLADDIAVQSCSADDFGDQNKTGVLGQDMLDRTIVPHP